MTFTLQRLFRTIARLDEAAGGPPWLMELWNPDTLAWESVGSAVGPAGVLYELRTGTVEFVLTTDGNVIGI